MIAPQALIASRDALTNALHLRSTILVMYKSPGNTTILNDDYGNTRVDLTRAGQLYPCQRHDLRYVRRPSTWQPLQVAAQQPTRGTMLMGASD